MSIQTDAKRFGKTDVDTRNATGAVHIENDEEFYKKDYQKAGIAVIFTQQKFLNEPAKFRHGADVDESNLISILSRFGYEVRHYRDYTTREIEEELKDIARENHSNNSSLIVVMMSHGGKDDYTNQGIIYTHDGQMNVDALWKYFAGDRCQSLVGKPKLFFIQACRGVFCDFGAVLEVEDDKRRNQNEEECSRSTKTASVVQKIPIMADILVMFSSADDHVSYRNVEDGSWFIEALCKRLEQYINSDQDKDLVTILTSVNRYVAFSKECVYNNKLSFKQMPVIMSMLTKTFMFDRMFFK